MESTLHQKQSKKASSAQEIRNIFAQPTLSDISKAAGVAVSTVSAILGDKKHCYSSKETYEKVFQAANKLGYRVNRFVPSLRGQKTFLIGLVLQDLVGNAVTMAKFACIETLAWQNGYRLLIGTHKDDPEKEKDYIHEFLGARVAGFIIAPSSKCDRELIVKMHDGGIPIVTADYSVDPSIPSVVVNREYGGYLAMRHMIHDAGRKHLAILLGVDNNTDSKLKGYERALVEAGSSLNEHVIIRTSGPVINPYDTGVSLAKQAISSGKKIDGIVLHSDTFAPGVMRVLYQNGMRVPKDVAIVGFDDDEFCNALPVSLTTVRQPRNVGEKAFELLWAQLKEDKETKSTESIVLSPELVVRESTTKPIEM